MIRRVLDSERGRPARFVGTAHRHGTSHTQQLPSSIVVGDPNGDGSSRLPQVHGQRLLGTQDESEPTGPVGLGKILRRAGNVLAQGGKHRRVGDEDWRRHVPTTLLGREQCGDGHRVERIYADAVDRVGGKHDALPLADGLGGTSQFLTSMGASDVEDERCRSAGHFFHGCHPLTAVHSR